MMYSLYMLDPDIGWHAVHQLSEDSAIQMAKEHLALTAGSLVAIAPHGVDPDPILKLVAFGPDYVGKIHLRVA